MVTLLNPNCAKMLNEIWTVLSSLQHLNTLTLTFKSDLSAPQKVLVKKLCSGEWGGGQEIIEMRNINPCGFMCLI